MVIITFEIFILNFSIFLHTFLWTFIQFSQQFLWSPETLSPHPLLSRVTSPFQPNLHYGHGTELYLTTAKPPIPFTTLNFHKRSNYFGDEVGNTNGRPNNKGKKTPPDHPDVVGLFISKKLIPIKKKEIKIIKKGGSLYDCSERNWKYNNFLLPSARWPGCYHQQNKSVFCFPVTGHRKRHSFFAMGGNSTDIGRRGGYCGSLYLFYFPLAMGPLFPVVIVAILRWSNLSKIKLSKI